MTMKTGLPTGMTRKRIEFTYDYLGRRVQKVVKNNWNGSSGTTVTHLRYVYDGNNLIAELNGSNNTVLSTYVWGLDLSGTNWGAGGVGGLLMIKDGSKVYFPGYDGNGNVSALLDSADGSLDAKYEYAAFGETLRVGGTAIADDNPFRFSTKYTDTESGLIYYGFRYYSPSLGRFLNRDPLGELGGSNLYGFVENDPVNGWDYLGLYLEGGSGESPGIEDDSRSYEDAATCIEEVWCDPFSRTGGDGDIWWENLMQVEDNLRRMIEESEKTGVPLEIVMEAYAKGDAQMLLNAIAAAKGEQGDRVLEDSEYFPNFRITDTDLDVSTGPNLAEFWIAMATVESQTIVYVDSAIILELGRDPEGEIIATYYNAELGVRWTITETVEGVSSILGDRMTIRNLLKTELIPIINYKQIEPQVWAILVDQNLKGEERLNVIFPDHQLERWLETFKSSMEYKEIMDKFGKR